MIDFVSHDMTINFDVFSTLMEDEVRSYLDSGLVVAIKGRRLNEGDPKIMEKIRKPLKFTCGRCQGLILCLRGASRNCGLFL